jgi:hypothetical protein
MGLGCRLNTALELAWLFTRALGVADIFRGSLVWQAAINCSAAAKKIETRNGVTSPHGSFAKMPYIWRSLGFICGRPGVPGIVNLAPSRRHKAFHFNPGSLTFLLFVLSVCYPIRTIWVNQAVAVVFLLHLSMRT